MGLTDTLGLGLVLSWKNRMSGEVKRAQRDLRGLERSAKGVTSRVAMEAERSRAATARYRGSLMSGMRMMAVGTAMAAPFLMTAKAASNLEEWLNDIEILLIGQGETVGYITKQMAAHKREILDMTGTTVIPMKELGATLWDLVSGLGSIEGRAGLKPAADLAITATKSLDEGMRSIGMSGRYLIQLLKTYGERWGDTLTPMQKATKIAEMTTAVVAGLTTDLTQLAGALTYSAGQANVLGVDLSELLVILGTAQTRGLRGQLAGTAFAAYLRQITQLEDKLGKVVETTNLSWDEYYKIMEKADTRIVISSKAKKAFSLLGLQITDAAGRLRSYPDILEDIERMMGITVKKLTEDELELVAAASSGAEALAMIGVPVEKIAGLQKAMGDEGSRIIAITLGQSEALKKNIRIVKEFDKMQEQLIKRLSGLNAQMIMTKESFKAAAAESGESWLPGMTDLVEKLNDQLKKLQFLIRKYPVETKWIVRIGSAAGGVVVLAGAINIMKWALGSMRLAGVRAFAVLKFAPRLSPWLALAAVLLEIATNLDKIKIAIGFLPEWFKTTPTPGSLAYETRKARQLGLSMLGASTPPYGPPAPEEFLRKTMPVTPDWLNKFLKSLMTGSFTTGFRGIPLFTPPTLALQTPTMNIPEPPYGPPAPAPQEIRHYHDSSKVEVHVHPPKGASAKDTARAVIDILKDKEQRSPKGKW